MQPINITITGSGNTTYCYVEINGTKRYGAGTYQVNIGDTLTFGVYGYSSTYEGYVMVDGSKILSSKDKSTQTLDWTVPVCAGINMSMAYTSSTTSRNGKITVETL